MEQRTRNWDRIIQGQSTNYVQVICWNYLEPVEAVYYEAQMWFNEKWSTRLFYTEKKLTSFVLDFQIADRGLPSSAARVLYKSVCDLLNSAQLAAEAVRLHNEFENLQGFLPDDTLVDNHSF